MFFKSVYRVFTPKERWEFFLLFLSVLSLGFVDMVGVAIIFPYFDIIANPEKIEGYRLLSILHEQVSGNNDIFFAVCGISFMVFFIIKNLFVFLSIYMQQHYLANKRWFFVSALYSKYMRNDYRFHLENDSVTLLKNMQLIDAFFGKVLSPLLDILAGLCTCVFVFALLMYANPLLTLSAMVSIIFPCVAIYFAMSKTQKRLGFQQHEADVQHSIYFLEGIHAIKEVQAMNRQSVFVEQVMKFSHSLFHIRKKLWVIVKAPSLILEVVLVSGIMIAVVFLLVTGSLLSQLPQIGLFAFAMFRLLASFSRILHGANAMKQSVFMKDTIIRELSNLTGYPRNPKQLLSNSRITRLSFEKTLEISNLSYAYPNSDKDTLKNLSFKITKGQSIGIVGESGSGKTTLIDVLLWLLRPTSGAILLDGKDIQHHLENWRSMIGYIPQKIHLINESIRKNIAFGIPDDQIDDHAVSKAVKIAQLDQVISELPKGIESKIGEGGIRLSGGQQQRIGIARALYNDPSVLIMDEATSALDSNTELKVSDAIELIGSDKTVITVAHRISTLRNCDCLYLVEKGKIVKVGAFEELVKKNEHVNALPHTTV